MKALIVLMHDNLMYVVASGTSATATGVYWLSSANEWGKLICTLCTIGAFGITLYKFIKEQKSKTNNEN